MVKDIGNRFMPARERFADIAPHSWYLVTLVDDDTKRLAWWTGEEWMIRGERTNGTQIATVGDKVPCKR